MACGGIGGPSDSFTTCHFPAFFFFFMRGFHPLPYGSVSGWLRQQSRPRARHGHGSGRDDGRPLRPRHCGGWTCLEKNRLFPLFLMLGAAFYQFLTVLGNVTGPGFVLNGIWLR